MICNFNKQDLSMKYDPLDFLRQIHSERFKDFEFFKTTAILGAGVLPSFKKMVEMIFPGILVSPTQS